MNFLSIILSGHSNERRSTKGRDVRKKPGVVHQEEARNAQQLRFPHNAGAMKEGLRSSTESFLIC